MQLTQFSDYALRVLMHLALQEEGQLVSIREVADTFKLSYNHLVKVVHKLSSEGLLVSKNGKGGGIRLGVDPEAVRIGDILRKTEEFELVECFKKEHNQCVVTPSCHLKGVLLQAHKAFMKVLDEKTLADVTKNREELLADLNR